MKKRKQLMSLQDVQHTLKRLSYEILEKNPEIEELCLVGIRGESSQTARVLHENLCGVSGQQISYREISLENNEQTQECSFLNKNVVLVVDVLFSGETIRRALGILCGAGRPQSVQLAALIDRGHRRYPIRANYVGKSIPTSLAEFIEVNLDADQAGIFISETEEL